LEVEATGQHGSCQDGNEALMALLQSEALCRWLHHQCVPSNCHQPGVGTVCSCSHTSAAV